VSGKLGCLSNMVLFQGVGSQILTLGFLDITLPHSFAGIAMNV
jgi:hypothetical protein